MFAIHETTRKRICRMAFVVLCIAPTVGTAAWIVDRRLPSHAAEQAERLGRLLQVGAELTGYREPRPQSVRCDTVTLTDSSTARALVRLQGIRMHNGEGSYSMSADSATIDSPQIAVLARRISLWMASIDAPVADFHLGRLAVNFSGREIVLGAVQARLERDAAGAARLRVAVRSSGASSESKPDMQLVVECTTPHAEAMISVFLEASAPLPAATLAGVPGIDALDAEARATGVIRWTLDQGGFTGAFKGRLDHVALAALLPTGSPHAATGRATVTLTELRWRNTRLERLEGALAIEQAAVSPSLIMAAVKHLYFVQTSDGVAASESPPMIAVDRLACRFLLDQKGLTLTGDMPPAEKLPAGCLATSGGVGLLLQPPYVDVPAGAWVQFVAGPANSWVPASVGAVKMAERLPLP